MARLETKLPQPLVPTNGNMLPENLAHDQLHQQSNESHPSTTNPHHVRSHR